MNPILIQQTSILSAIFGGAMGVLTLIPIVRNITFLVLILLAATVVLIYMKKYDLIGIFDVREGAILGAIIGFVSFLAFSIIFIPLCLLIGWIFGKFGITYYTYGLNYLFRISGFFVLIMLTVFVAFMSALMNAFSGLATAYVYEFLSGIKKAEEQGKSVDFEIK